MGEVGSVSSSNPLDTDGSDDEECEVNDMALGSSFITSGSDSSGEDNETKKPRLDQSMTESEGVEGQDVMENVSMTEVTSYKLLFLFLKRVHMRGRGIRSEGVSPPDFISQN